MSTALMRTQQDLSGEYDYRPRSADDAMKLARWFVASKLYPAVQSPEAMVTIFAKGARYGWDPITSLDSFDIIQGRTAMRADAIAGLVLSSGKARFFRCVESTDTQATYETHRIGDDAPKRDTFTIEHARVMGLLSKENWKRMPMIMLRHRAAALCGRTHYPDVVGGMLTPDEVTDLSFDQKLPSGSSPPVISTSVIETSAVDVEPSASPPSASPSRSEQLKARLRSESSNATAQANDKQKTDEIDQPEPAESSARLADQEVDDVFESVERAHQPQSRITIDPPDRQPELSVVDDDAIAKRDAHALYRRSMFEEIRAFATELVAIFGREDAAERLYDIMGVRTLRGLANASTEILKERHEAARIGAVEEIRLARSDLRELTGAEVVYLEEPGTYDLLALTAMLRADAARLKRAIESQKEPER